MDNVFVFALLLSYFAVPAQYQHNVLFCGVLGALVMRAIMLGAGSVLIARFSWIIYVFGAFLIPTGIIKTIIPTMPPMPIRNRVKCCNTHSKTRLAGEVEVSPQKPN